MRRSVMAPAFAVPAAINSITAITAIAVLATIAEADGVDLSWNDCVGTAQAASNRDFNCAGTTNQFYPLLLQFKVYQDLPSFVALTATVRMFDETPGPLAPFWHFETGGCQRLGGASPDGVTLSLAKPMSCADAGFDDPWGGDGLEGLGVIATYTSDYPNAAHARFLLVAATSSPPFPIGAGVNYYALSLIFNTRNRATCAGCTDRVNLLCDNFTLESGDGSPPVVLVTPDKFTNCVTINRAALSLCADPVRKNGTWGAIKALYR
jgi:hypothetical protein